MAVLDGLVLIGEWIAAIILLAAIGYTILGGIGYLIHKRRHRDEY